MVERVELKQMKGMCTHNYCKHKYLQLAKFSEGKQAHCRLRPTQQVMC